MYRTVQLNCTCTVLLFRQTDAHFELDSAAAGSTARRPVGEILGIRLRCRPTHIGTAARTVAVASLLPYPPHLREQQIVSFFEQLNLPRPLSNRIKYFGFRWRIRRAIRILGLTDSSGWPPGEKKNLPKHDSPGPDTPASHTRSLRHRWDYHITGSQFFKLKIQITR